MNETDIHLEICVHFDKHQIHDFEFLKVVGGNLVVPQVGGLDN